MLQSARTLLADGFVPLVEIETGRSAVDAMRVIVVLSKPKEEMTHFMHAQGCDHTGHKTVRVLLNHYFKPGREEIRRMLQEKMPKLLSPAGGVGSRVTPLPQAIREKLKVMTAENWSQIRDEILGIFDAGVA